MKRPVAIFGLLYFLFQVAAIYLTFKTYAALAIIIAFICVLCFILKLKCKFLAVIIFVACISVMLVFNMHKLLTIKPIQSLNGKSYTVTATVYNTSKSYNSNFVNAKLIVNNISGANNFLQGSFNAAATLPAVSTGDIVTFNGTFKAINEPNEKFYYPDYIFISLDNISDFEYESESSAFWYFAKTVQNNISMRIAKYVSGDVATVMQTMSVGDDSFMSDDTKLAFTHTGLSHVLVVSGMHLGIVSACVYFACLLFLKSRISAVLAMASSVMFAFIAGTSPSSARAVLIILFYYGAKIICRKSDVYISLALAAVIMCINNPYAAVDVGTLLSFSATFGVLSASSFLQTQNNKNHSTAQHKNSIEKALQYMAIPIAANIFTLPVLVIFNMGFSLVGVLCNMASAVFVPFITVGSMFFGFFADTVILKPIAMIFGLAAVINSRFIISITEIAGAIPGVYMYASGIAATFCVIAVNLLFYVAYKNNYNLIKMLALPFCFVVACLSIFYYSSKNVVQISLVGTDSSSAMVISSQNKASVIFNGTTYNIDDVQNELDTLNFVEIETVIDLRKNGDANQMLQAFGCNNIILGSDINSYKFVNLHGNVYADINHQSNGNYACVYIGDVSLGIYSGDVDFSAYESSDILVKSGGDAINHSLNSTLWYQLNYDNALNGYTNTNNKYADYLLVSANTQRIKWGEHSVDYK